MDDPNQYVIQLGKNARRAAGELAGLNGAAKVAVLHKIAAALTENQQALLDANAKDITAAEAAGLDAPLVHRLRLDPKKIKAMADGVMQIAGQVDPVGQIIEGYVRPNGLRITKMRVPLGVVLFFYESRPNVTSDAAALCIKSGNAIILRGGKEAFHSNRAIVTIVEGALKSADVDPAAVQFVDSTDRALVPLLLKLDKYIDLVIPRGGKSLITAVVKDATMPVLKHFDGNCHLFIDKGADTMADDVRKVCVNAKTSYAGGAVCNAVEHLLFHQDVAATLVPMVCEELKAKGVEVRGDEATRKLWPAAKATTPEDWDTEYLAFIIGIKVVKDMDEAIAHINEHGSHHTDGILSPDRRSIDRFITRVDSASVMVNASTRFADGGEYGLGAEIGISTDKLHARGPMGGNDLTTYKWIVAGDGHVR
jgi:glutamate-5-semialdehyde dehydrogenase